MLPNVAGPSATCQQILIHSLLLVPASFGPLLIQGVGLSYAAAAALVDALLVRRALALYRLRDGDESPRRKAAMALFGYSILYMFLVFAALLVQRHREIEAPPCSAERACGADEQTWRAGPGPDSQANQPGSACPSRPCAKIRYTMTSSSQGA